MTDITVSQFAQSMNTSVDNLLEQMKEAGLPHKKAGEIISDEDKEKLLAHYKHPDHTGESAAPQQITLKRKQQTTLKAGGHGKKAVTVEVRKKRTFVKPNASAEELQSVDADAGLAEEQVRLEAAEKARLEAQAAEKARLEAEAAEKARLEAQAAEKARLAAEEKAQQELEAKKKELEEKAKKDPLDPEILRQQAALRRQEAERKAALEHAELMRAKAAAEAEEKARKEAAEKARKEAENARKAKTEKAKSDNKPAAAKPVNKEPAKVAPAPVADGDDTELKHRRIKTTTDDADDSKDKGRVAKAGKSSRNKNRAHKVSVHMSEDGEYEEEERPSRRKIKRLDVRKQAFERPTEKISYEVELQEMITVSDLAQKMNVKAGELIKQLMGLGVMATVNQALDRDTAILLIEEMGHSYKLISETQLEDDLLEGLASKEGELETRAPVVSVMGHVDHGKTSLLDYIRKTHVTSGEAGGITQHIGAYHVNTDKGMISFLDTPGHAAFTAMRARGAKSTDIVILVVAADDSVMPQTREAIAHARAAGVPIVVAITKIDKPAANINKVKEALAAEGVQAEDWGGDVQFVAVSAHTGEGIDSLLEALILQAELLELKAAKNVPARGVVVESRLDKGLGTVATVLVQSGTLKPGDIVLAGEQFGRVRAMMDENGQKVQSAGPSIPVEILGLNGTPEAGDDFFVVESEKKAREVAEFRNQRAREARLARQQVNKLENLFENLGKNEKQVLNLVLKADVRGTLEAIQAALMDIGNDEVAVNIVSAGVGGITESDANLALTANAVIFGFNVRAETAAKQLCEKEGIDLRYYSIIYNLLDDVKQALSGMLSPEFKEQIVGIAEVRDTFNSPKYGLIAGCMVVEGTVYRNKPIRVLRENVVIYEGELESLRRYKDDVSDVRHGMECGIGVKNYLDVRVGDQIEVFDREKVIRTL